MAAWLYTSVLWMTVVCMSLPYTEPVLIELTASTEGEFVTSNSTGTVLPLVNLSGRFSIVTNLTLSSHPRHTCNLFITLPSLLSLDDSLNITVTSYNIHNREDRVICSATNDDEVNVITSHVSKNGTQSDNNTAELTVWVVAQNPTGITIDDTLVIGVNGSCSSNLSVIEVTHCNDSCSVLNSTNSWLNDSCLQAGHSAHNISNVWTNGSCYWDSDIIEMQFGGPEVVVVTPVDEMILPDDNQSHAVLMTLPGYWQMNDVIVSFEFHSWDLNFVEVAVVEFAVGPLYPESSSINVSTVEEYTEALIKRSIGSITTFAWSIGNINNNGPDEDQLQIKLIYQIPSSQPISSGYAITLDTVLLINDTPINLEESVYLIAMPVIVLRPPEVILLQLSNEDSSVVSMQDNFRVTITALNWNDPLGAPAYNVSLSTHREGFHIHVNSLEPSIANPAIEITNEEVIIKDSPLEKGDELVISYKGYFTDEFIKSAMNTVTVVSEITWNLEPSNDPSASYRSTSNQFCLQKIKSYDDDTLAVRYIHLIWIFLLCSLVGGLLMLLVLLVVSRRGGNKVHSMGDHWGGAHYDTAVRYSGWYANGEHSAKMRYVYCVGYFVAGLGFVGTTGLLVLLVVSRRGSNKVHSMGDHWGGAHYDTAVRYSGWYGKGEHSAKMRDDAKNESIVYYLTQKDKRMKHIELGKIDIMMTINIDIQLEELRLNSMMQSFELLLSKFGSMSSSARDSLQKAYKKASRNAKDVVRELNNEYRQKIQEIEARHQHELKTNRYQLEKKHAVIRRNAEEETRNLDGKTAAEILGTLDQQRDLEISETQHLMELSHGEEAERLRKKYDIKKRIAIRRLQQQSLDEVTADDQLDASRGRQLLMEYRDMCVWLDKFIDAEISEQRVTMDQSMAEKKGLAEQKNSEEDWNKRLLNTVATQTAKALTELERDNRLSGAESQQYLDKVRGQLQAAKEKYDLNRATQHAALHTRLTKLKKERLAEKEKEQLEALSKFEQEQHIKLKQNEQDPQVYLESKLMMISSQRSDLVRLSGKLDDQAKEELDQMESELVDKTKQEMVAVKENLCATLIRDNGLTERMKNELLEQHQRDIERMEEERDAARKKQETQIEDRLTRLREDLAIRKQQEREEKENIENYEENMVNKLLATQVAVSDEDRQKVMEECRKNMIAVEDGLAVNKLRQQRMLEEKLAKMRSRRMVKMEKKHDAETRRQMRSAQLDGERESEDTENKTTGELLQKQAAEKLSLMTSVSDDVDMETIREEMLQERSLSLQRQEEKLGAMMAQLQLDKAREMATIEEQQKALLQLKMNMFDEMTETGVIKNSQANKVIEAHQKGLESLEKKVNAQRERQEEALKERLREKMMEREKSMEMKLERELTEVGRDISNSTVMKLKSVVLRHKHMKQREQFRIRMEVEISQTLEEVRRQFEMDKAQKLHDQEMLLLSALVKFGGFSETEMKNVLSVLFPAKNPEEISGLIKGMFVVGEKQGVQEPATERKKDPLKMLLGFKRGKKSVSSESETLEEKVRKTISATGTGKQPDKKNRRRRSSIVNLLKKGRLAPLVREVDEEAAEREPMDWALPDISTNQRPEPIGRAAQPEHSSHEAYSDIDESDDDGPREAVLL